MAQNTGLNKSKVSPDDVHAISHINYVTNGIHDLANELYEDLMERDHEKAKIKASNICKLMSDLIHSMTDEI
tara:strand:- start:270 stop:485 length:216 start_codon:yes stop_codon:yes gene_type:complete